LRKSLINDTWFCVCDFDYDNRILTRETTAGVLVSGGAGEAWRLLSVQDYEQTYTPEAGTIVPKYALPGYDGRGNIVTWTNGLTGELIGTADYGPYGERFDMWWATEADEVSYERFGFGTEYRDETGLIYYGARYYSPALGRFISRDPAGVAGSGVNLYAFCSGDPVNNRELYGLCDSGWFGDLCSALSSVVSAICSAVSYVADAIGGVLDYFTSDQEAVPESNPEPSGATGVDPGCQVIGVDQNGNYIVAVTNQEEFDKRVSEYQQRHNGENPVLATCQVDRDFIDRILSDSAMQREFTKYLSLSIGGYSSKYATYAQALAAEVKYYTELANTEFFCELPPFEVWADQYTPEERHFMYLQEMNAWELRQERIDRASFHDRCGLNQPLPVREYADTGVDPVFKNVQPLDFAVVASVRAVFNGGGPQLAYSPGVYFAFGPKSGVCYGFCGSTELGLGNEAGAGFNLAVYNTSNFHGEYLSQNLSVGFFGGSIFSDTRGNPNGMDVNIGVNVCQVSFSSGYGYTINARNVNEPIK
jgi:RHS repeat-associated protein